jgi:hypothetical protein
LIWDDDDRSTAQVAVTIKPLRVRILNRFTEKFIVDSIQLFSNVVSTHNLHLIRSLRYYGAPFLFVGKMYFLSQEL